MNTRILLSAIGVTALAGFGTALHARQRPDTIVKRIPANAPMRVATLVTEVTVGRADGPAEYIIGNLEAFALRRDGSIFIGEAGGNVAHVRQYDSTGRYVRTLGRKGEGPGEFDNIGGIAFHPDGRILVLDGGRPRIHVFSATGAFLTTWQLDRFVNAGSGEGFHNFFMTPSGITVLPVRTIPFSPPVIPPPVLFARLNASGVVIDTLPPPPSPFPPPVLSGRTNSGAPRNLMIPFGRAHVVRMSQLGYYVTGRNDRRGFELYLPGGTGAAANPWTPGAPITSIQHETPPVPFTAEQRQYLTDRVGRSMQTMGSGWNWNGNEVPRNRPIFQDIVTNADGRVFLVGFDPQRNYTIDELADWDDGVPMIMDAYEPDGRYVGRIRTDQNSYFLPAFGEKGLVAKLVNDVPQISRVRIEWR